MCFQMQTPLIQYTVRVLGQKTKNQNCSIPSRLLLVQGYIEVVWVLCCGALFPVFFVYFFNLSLYFVCFKDGNGVVRGYYLSVFLELSAGLPETSK